MQSIIIRLRYSTGAYHASAYGHKAKVSSTISGQHAAEALVRKICPTNEVERVESLGNTGVKNTIELRFHFKQVLGV